MTTLGLIYNDKYWYTGRSWPALGGANLGFIASNVPQNTNRILSGPLGIYPDDAHLSLDYQYLPVEAGWTQYGFNGSNFGSPMLIAEAAAATATGDQDRLQILVEVQKRQSMMQMVSTVAIAAIASIAIVNLFRGR